ncbi:MAG TPA: DinB family protein [Gemmatimonadales bacterium]|nr:DinB family protein [Gemmatimonadales bacterium]
MSAELDRHARLFRYDIWANAETLASLQRVTPPQALRWMGHIVSAELLWLGRLVEEPSELAVWPELDVEQIAAWLPRLEQAWPQYLAGLSEDDLADGVGYRNSLGEFWTNSVDDILTHVVIHSAYHRGQIAAAVRTAGGEPAYTDVIHAVRQGLIE